MKVALCFVLVLLLVAEDIRNVQSSDEGIQKSSSTSESKDDVSTQGFISDTTHQVGKLRNILSTVGRLKNAFNKHGVPGGRRASNTGQTHKMLDSPAQRVKHVQRPAEKAVPDFAGDQSYLGRVETPDSPETNTNAGRNDGIHGDARKQRGRDRNQQTRQHKSVDATKSLKERKLPADMYKKMILYCSKLHKTMNEKRKDYYRTKGCRDPRKCKSYTKIHHITRDYESVTYRSSTASRLCSKFVYKLDDRENRE